MAVSMEGFMPEVVLLDWALQSLFSASGEFSNSSDDVVAVPRSNQSSIAKFERSFDGQGVVFRSEIRTVAASHIYGISSGPVVAQHHSSQWL